MCGISGIAGLNDKVKMDSAIRRMNDCMSHRGPDADGFYINDDIAFGHRRLSILDLSAAANQPFWDSEGRYVMVFNGEIYNFKEVKAQITDYPFKTSGDTEVVIAAYAKWGPACLQYFKGMFALAIWDTRNKTMFVARDRFGVKPLYYYAQDNLLLLASEIRSILASDMVPRSLNETALYDYLMFQSAITPVTLVKQVMQLPAGSYMIWGAGKAEIKTYWTASGNRQLPETDSYDAIKTKVRDLLYKAVERRLVSDVPLGTFLSGGIDSGIIAGIMAETNSQRTNAFTIAFEEKQFDESEYAAMVAKKFNLNHTKVLLRPSNFLEELPTALNALDTPSGDGLNTYVVSKAIRKSGIVVAMSGVGGDELFAGYPFFPLFLRLQHYNKLFRFTRVMRQVVKPLLPGNDQKLLRLKDLLQTGSTEINDLYPFFREIATTTNIKRLTKLKLPGTSGGHLQNLLNEQQAATSQFPLLSQVSIAEYLGYTQHVLLKDTDQMGMAASLEIREPFFDHELVEYVLNVPDKYKTGKYKKNLLVESTWPLLPEAIINRPKQGFVLPYDHWMRNELNSFCKEKITNLASRPWFNGKAVEAFWHNYVGRKNNIRSTDIWILIVLENWLEKNNVA